ncbi:MAG: SDR family oxidoreductase [Bacteroidia bacterium]|nr:SDR family oxidoreductase [Bacteroidia bacterium]
MNDFQLNNKTILITGASSGIGKATALIASSMGASLVICGRDEKRLNETLHALHNSNQQHQAIIADLSTQEGITHLIKQCPKLDGIVHCAGIVKPVPIKFIQQKHIDEMFSINYNSVVLINSNLLQQKKIGDNASIVLISTISTQHSYFGGALYTSSKAALEAYCRSLALELAGKKVRVNTISPAMVKTEIYENTLKTTLNEEHAKKYESTYPFGIGEAKDVANAIVFLLSNASKWITGTTIKMDGGLTLGYQKND